MPQEGPAAPGWGQWEGAAGCLWQALRGGWGLHIMWGPPQVPSKGGEMRIEPEKTSLSSSTPATMRFTSTHISAAENWATKHVR